MRNAVGKWKSTQLIECIQRTAIPIKIPKGKFENSGLFPIISQEQEFINGYWSDKSAVISPKSSLVVFGDHTQVLKYVDFEFVVGADGVKLLNPKQFLNAKYLYYFLMANPIGKLGYARHYRLLKHLIVRYPQSLAEQKHIAAVLDRALAIIDRAKVIAERNCANAREIFANCAQNIFSNPRKDWETKKLGEVCRFVRGLTYSKKDEVDFSRNIVLRANNINAHQNVLNLSDLRYLKEDINFPHDKIIRKDHIFICTASGSKEHLGKVAFIDCDYGYACGGFMGQILPEKTIVPKFLYYALITKSYKSFILSLSDGTNINNLRFGDLAAFPVPLPPLAEQKRIVATLDTLSAQTKRLEQIYRHKGTNLNELRQVLLNKAFAGLL